MEAGDILVPWTRQRTRYQRMADDQTAAVVVDGLRVFRGSREVLPGISLTVPRGQVVGLLGPNGGGKTTLLRSIVGVQIIAGGTVTVLGEPAGSPGLRSRVGYVTQDASVYADLTVRANLTYFAALAGAPRADVERVIEVVDLTTDVDTRVDRLSGGQRSRVSLAAALIGSPELLVLDEPTVGLDPVLRRDLWALFRRLAGEGTTLLVSSHVMDEAARCDRLLLLREGRLLADDSPDGLLARTGAPDAEQAFFALIETEGAA
jgi:ABC-2 type transport system ATP-binding protein